MKANTALCFLLAGVSLGLQSKRHFLTPQITKGCAIALTAIAFLTLYQYFFDWNLGIDELLFLERPLSPATSHPGRMGINTAINFGLTGAALWLSSRRDKTQRQPQKQTKVDRIAISQVLATVAGLIALQAVVGYAYNVRVFYKISAFTTSMSLHTALTFGALCVGILALKSNRGLMQTLTSNAIGGDIARRFIPAAIVVPLVLGWLILQGQQANLYDPNFALSLMSVSLVVISLGLIGRSAGILNQVDRDRKRSDERLRSSEERLQLALGGARQGIWDWHLKRQVLTWDDRCKEIFGLLLDVPLTYEWHLEAIHPDDRQRVSEAAAIALRDRGEFVEEYRTFHPDGTMRWVLAQGRGYYEFSGEPYRMLGTVMDISDRKLAEIALQHQAKELLQANRLKDEFLAALSHELRTPLNPILGWTTMLRGQKLTPAKAAQALETIERNTRQQIRLVDDLLDVSRVIQGKLTLEFHPVDLLMIVNSAIDTVQFAAQAKGIAIAIQGLPSLTAMGDCDRLQQVFWNLLSNAIKFTPNEGRVEVELAIVSKEDAAFSAQIRVTDTGIGIASEFLPHVFESFRQADGSTTRKYGGLGLGLAIVRHLVELHGGTVAAESPGIGQGATFTVKLPLRTVGSPVVSDSLGEAPLPQFQSLPLASQTTPLVGIRIFLVDDELDNLELLRFLLQENGAEVTALTSPLKALELVADNPPDLLVSDLGMPQIDGYQLIRQVRALPQGRFPLLPSLRLLDRKPNKHSLRAFKHTFLNLLTPSNCLQP